MNEKFHHWFCHFLTDEVCTTADCTSSGEHCFCGFCSAKHDLFSQKTETLRTLQKHHYTWTTFESLVTIR